VLCGVRDALDINVPVPHWQLTQPPNYPATTLAWDVICPPFPESRHRSANPAKSVIKIGRGLEGVNAKRLLAAGAKG